MPDIVNNPAYTAPGSATAKIVGPWLEALKPEQPVHPAAVGTVQPQDLPVGAPPKAGQLAVDWVGQSAQRPVGLPKSVATLGEIKGALDSGQVGGVQGWQTAVDSRAVEDLSLRVARMKSGSQEGYYLRLRLREPAAGLVTKDSSFQSGGLSAFAVTSSSDGTHLVPGTGNALISLSVKGKTYRQSADWGEVRMHDAPGSPAADNLVEVFVKKDKLDDATLNDILTRLHATPGYSTPGDQRVMAASRLLHIFSTKPEAAADAAGELAKIKKQWDVSPEDVTVEHDGAGQLEFLLPDSVVQKIMTKYDCNAFFSTITNGDMVNVLESPHRASLSSVERFLEGVGKSGMSSSSDIKTGGADYVFTRQTNFSSKIPSHAGTIVYDGSRMLRRMDWHAYSSDSFGKAVEGTQYDTWSLASLSAKGGSQETMFKHRISFDDVEYIIIANPLKLIQQLESRGWATWTDGRPLETVIVKPGTPLTPRGGAKMKTMVPKLYSMQGWTTPPKSIEVPEGHVPQPKTGPGWEGTWTSAGAGSKPGTWLYKWTPELTMPGTVNTNVGPVTVQSAQSSSPYKWKIYVTGESTVPEPIFSEWGQWKPVGKASSKGFKYPY